MGNLISRFIAWTCAPTTWRVRIKLTLASLVIILIYAQYKPLYHMLVLDVPPGIRYEGMIKLAIMEAVGHGVLVAMREEIYFRMIPVVIARAVKMPARVYVPAFLIFGSIGFALAHSLPGNPHTPIEALQRHWLNSLCYFLIFFKCGGCHKGSLNVLKGLGYSIAIHWLYNLGINLSLYFYSV